MVHVVSLKSIRTYRHLRTNFLFKFPVHQYVCPSLHSSHHDTCAHSMCVLLRASACVCVCVCVCVHTYACFRELVRAWYGMFVCMYIIVHPCYTYNIVCAWITICMYACMHVCMHTTQKYSGWCNPLIVSSTYTHIHTYIHTRIQHTHIQNACVARCDSKSTSHTYLLYS